MCGEMAGDESHTILLGIVLYYSFRIWYAERPDPGDTVHFLPDFCTAVATAIPMIIAVLLAVAVAIAAIPLPMWIFWIAASLFGVAMGSTWVVSRTMIIELSHEGKEGQFFGLFAFSAKMSAVIGPFIYGKSI